MIDQGKRTSALELLQDTAFISAGTIYDSQ
jgi:hypothetical protein